MYVHIVSLSFLLVTIRLYMQWENLRGLWKIPSRNIKARSYRTFDANSFINDWRQVPWSKIEASDNPDLAWSMFKKPIYSNLC